MRGFAQRLKFAYRIASPFNLLELSRRQQRPSWRTPHNHEACNDTYEKVPRASGDTFHQRNLIDTILIITSSNRYVA